MSQQSNWNTNLYPPQNSPMTVSRIEPQLFESPTTATIVRSNAWVPTNLPNNNEMNQITNTNSKSGCSKICAKVTSTKVLIFLIGLILCGIPLAVMTTLWINERSVTDTTSTTTITSATNKTTVTTVSSTTSLLLQCYTYSNLNDAYRNIQNGWTCCSSPYDSSLTAGWYRISGSAGTQLVSTPIYTTSTCGASYPGYYNGTLPSTTGTVTTGNVCFYSGTSCSYSLSPISVTNCSGYYIFYLLPTSSSNYKYCTTN